MKSFLKACSDLFFPDYLMCGLCGDDLVEATHFCKTCVADALVGQPLRCSTCGRELDISDEHHKAYYGKCKQCQENYYYFKKHQAFTRYEGRAKHLLLALKYKGETQHLSVITSGLCLAAGAIDSGSDFDVIIPVPIHKKRALMRGFNQSEMFTREMAKKMIIPSVNALERVKATKKLKNLNKTSRKLTLKNAIIVKNGYKESIENKKILLVDDIFTTGETLNTCAEALYKANAGEIYAVTFAMGNDT